ncbi:unnamed protein product [Ostreobium quekettii]|uniref:protein-serine/threonine phosphatase n=1 Tax=Ostreobium quekettii TaxID=121088 RepID=A0A8S1J9K8_9CHLO|nr:unnamed protein product [Ostreobium quekettii]
MCKWALYCVCDGHGGRSAAKFMEDNLAKEMAKRLPDQCPPPLFTEGWQAWGSKVREAVVDTFLQLDKEFEAQGSAQQGSSTAARLQLLKQKSTKSGCTASVALVCGHLLTVANIGDSEAFLDTGRKYIVEMTKSHKIDINIGEQERLRAAGRQVTQLGVDLFRPAEEGEKGVGPLRVWPSGLAVSRSVGDFDCGSEVTAAPHVRQVEIPLAGARLILASDGVWDHITGKQACKTARKSRIHEVPEVLIRLVETKSNHGGLTDDTSVLVVDMLPNSRVDFKDVTKKLRSPLHAFKRFVQLKEAVRPELLADYDGVEKKEQVEAAKVAYGKATTFDLDARQRSISEEEDDSQDLFVLGSNHKPDTPPGLTPGSNVSKIILNPDALAQSKSL